MDVERSFSDAVEEGRRRLHRSWPRLLATGAVGGADIAIGLLAFLIVYHETGNQLLGALAFGIGFIALTLASSELFTENFLIPVVAVAIGEAKIRNVVRLLAGTLVMNLLAGWFLIALVVLGFPEIRPTAVETALFYTEQGLTVRAFALSLLGGAIITLFTWMERGTASMLVRVVAGYATGFLLLAGPVNHSIVGSLEIFAALQFGAPFGYLDWAGIASLMIVGNTVGGVVLITMLRLVQVGPEQIQKEQAKDPEERGEDPSVADRTDAEPED